MLQVTFHVKTITPLFIAGADQTTAELRAPTFRGLMRYWYRALIGGIVGADERSLPKVMEEETKLFGATDTGSAITVRVSTASKVPQTFKKESYSRANVSGRDYLLWSMAASGKGERYKADRLFFPQNTTFQVTLSSRGNDDTKLQRAVAALWLLTHLGSVGSRSRRGAGSVAAQVIDGDTAGFHFDVPKDVEDLQNQISGGIKTAQQLARHSLPNPALTLVTQASFDALAQKTCRIWILRDSSQAWHTPDAAMRAIGISLQTYRSGLPLQSRTVFGLPLMGVDNKARRASPLLLRIVELQGGTYVGIAVLFKTGSNQNYRLIENWTNSFSGKVEVTL